MDPVPVLGVIVIVSVLAGLLHRTASARAAQGIQAGATPSPTSQAPSLEQATPARALSKEEILATGTEGHARVLRATPTGERDGEGREIYDLLFEVRLEGMPSFQAPSRAAVPTERAARMVAGAELAVRADPTNPQVMAVDWEHTE